MTYLLILLAMALAFTAFISGWHAGYKCGQNEEWLTRYFEQVRQDRERRDANGKFKARATP